MRHRMKLRMQPFSAIRSGQKTFELRLFDEKRQLLRVNDEIEFSCIDSNEAPIIVQILSLQVFKSFAEPYNNLPLLQCGYTEETISDATPNDMNQYYNVEKQEKYGVVGIEIKVI